MLNTNAKINKHLMWSLCNFRPMLQHGMVFKKMKNDAIKKVVKSDCLDKFCIRYVLILLFVFYKSLRCKLISNFLSRLLPDLREYYRIFMFHMKTRSFFLKLFELASSSWNHTVILNWNQKIKPLKVTGLQRNLWKCKIGFAI